MLKLAALVLGLCMAPGCATKLGMTSLLGASERDSEVVWLVVTEKAFDTKSTLYACYRKPKQSPGHPTCYLSEFVQTKSGVAPK